MARRKITRTRGRAGEERERQHARDQAEYNAAQQENTNSLTDSGNARRLIEQHGADIRYVAQLKTWYIWNGRYWEQDKTGEIMRRAQQTVKSLYLEAYNTEDRVARRALVDWARQSESNSRLKAMVEIAQFQSEVVATPDQFDGQDWLLNCRNCTVDLRRGVALKHNREHMLTSALPFDYDPEAQCPTFLAFLDTIMGGNQRLIAFLQRAIGYTLTGDVREECVFIPWGDGSNGKSTLLNVICALLGAFSRSISPDTLTATKRQRDGAAASPDIARLRGARFAYAIEAEEGHALSESRVKQLSSRENIAARGVYEEMAEFPPTWKIWYATNHKPVVHGTDDAIWRRMYY
jgi:putative DNA primase/helicase